MNSIKAFLSKALAVLLMLAGVGLILATAHGLGSTILEDKYSTSNAIAAALLAGIGIWLLVLARRFYKKDSPPAVAKKSKRGSSSKKKKAKDAQSAKRAEPPEDEDDDAEDADSETATTEESRPTLNAEMLAFAKKLREESEAEAMRQSASSPKATTAKGTGSATHSASVVQETSKHMASAKHMVTATGDKKSSSSAGVKSATSKATTLSPLEQLFIGWIKKEFELEPKSSTSYILFQGIDAEYCDILTADMSIVLYKEMKNVVFIMDLKDVCLKAEHFTHATVLANAVNQRCKSGHFQVIENPLRLRFRHSIDFTDTDVDESTFNSLLDQGMHIMLTECSYAERIKAFNALDKKDIDTILHLFHKQPQSLPPTMLNCGRLLH